MLAIKLIDESKLLTFTPVEGATVNYRKIGKKRYSGICSECRIDDRGPEPVDRAVLERLVAEVIEKDGTYKNVDLPEASNRILNLLMVSKGIEKTDWKAVQIRTLLWAIDSWEGIGFEGETAPVTQDSVEAFADTDYGDQLFTIVLEDVTAMREREAADPLGRSGSTSNSVSKTAGASAKSATKNTSKTRGDHPALRTPKAGRSKKGK